MMIRQGDVMLVPVAKLPVNVTQAAPDGHRVVLAYGETSGHAHALAKELAIEWIVPNTPARYLQVTAPAAPLTHEEHDTIIVPHGIYEIVRQRQAVPGSGISTQVAD